MSLIDSVDFHLEAGGINSQEEFLNAGIVIGLFFKWAAYRRQLSDQFFQDNAENLELLLAEKIGMVDYCNFHLDGKLKSDFFSKRVIHFLKDYYVKGKFISDLKHSFGEHESIYQIPDSKESFKKAATILDYEFDSFDN